MRWVWTRIASRARYSRTRGTRSRVYPRNVQRVRNVTAPLAQRYLTKQLFCIYLIYGTFFAIRLNSEYSARV